MYYFFFLGMMQAIQNLGLALCNMLTGLIVDQEGYIWLEMFFIFWLAVALVCTIAVWLIDISGDGYLNMGTQQREDFDKAKRLKEEEEARLKASLANPIRPRTGKQLRNRYVLSKVRIFREDFKTSIFKALYLLKSCPLFECLI